MDCKPIIPALDF